MKPSSASIVNRGISAAALLLITWFFAWLSFGASFDESYLVIIRVMALITYLLLLPSILLAIAGRPKTPRPQSAVTVVSYSALLIGLLAAIAWWSDASHPCAGDYTHCSSILFLLTYLALQPFILLPVLLVLIVIFAVGFTAKAAKPRSTR